MKSLGWILCRPNERGLWMRSLKMVFKSKYPQMHCFLINISSLLRAAKEKPTLCTKGTRLAKVTAPQNLLLKKDLLGLRGQLFL